MEVIMEAQEAWKPKASVWGTDEVSKGIMQTAVRDKRKGFYRN